jgi:hypothetical protein
VILQSKCLATATFGPFQHRLPLLERPHAFAQQRNLQILAQLPQIIDSLGGNDDFLAQKGIPDNCERSGFIPESISTTEPEASTRHTAENCTASKLSS